MKATIFRPDGTRIEAEGTPEEVAKLAPPAPYWPIGGGTASVCICCGGLMAGVWCPVHGYRPTWPLYPTVIWGGIGQNNAAAANPTTVFLGNVNVAGVLS